MEKLQQHNLENPLHLVLENALQKDIEVKMQLFKQDTYFSNNNNILYRISTNSEIFTIVPTENFESEPLEDESNDMFILLTHTQHQSSHENEIDMEKALDMKGMHIRSIHGIGFLHGITEFLYKDGSSENVSPTSNLINSLPVETLNRIDNQMNNPLVALPLLADYAYQQNDHPIALIAELIRLDSTFSTNEHLQIIHQKLREQADQQSNSLNSNELRNSLQKKLENNSYQRLAKAVMLTATKQEGEENTYKKTLTEEEQQQLEKDGYVILGDPKGKNIYGFILDLDGTLHRTPLFVQKMREIEMQKISDDFGWTMEQTTCIFKQLRDHLSTIEGREAPRLDVVKMLGYSQSDWAEVRATFPTELIEENPDVVKTVMELDKEGFRIAIATQSTLQGAINILKKIGFTDPHNSILIYGRSGFDKLKKHDQEFYNLVAKGLGFHNAHHLLAIGDSILDATIPSTLGAGGAVVKDPRATVKLLQLLLKQNKE